MLSLYALLSVLLFARAWCHLLTRSIGEQAADSQHFMWLYVWTPWALGRLPNEFHTAWTTLAELTSCGMPRSRCWGFASVYC